VPERSLPVDANASASLRSPAASACQTSSRSAALRERERGNTHRRAARRSWPSLRPAPAPPRARERERQRGREGTRTCAASMPSRCTSELAEPAARASPSTSEGEGETERERGNTHLRRLDAVALHVGAGRACGPRQPLHERGREGAQVAADRGVGREQLEATHLRGPLGDKTGSETNHEENHMEHTSSGPSTVLSLVKPIHHFSSVHLLGVCFKLLLNHGYQTTGRSTVSSPRARAGWAAPWPA
jgi:hypothetical protein